MQVFTTRVKTNLDGVLQMTQMIDGIMMTGDNAANEILVELYRGIDRITIPQGTKIVGYFIRSDGYTLEEDGVVTENNEAKVVIPEVAYQVSGNLSIAIRMFDGAYTATYRGYYDESNTFIQVTDESATEGPNGEPIVTKEFQAWETKIVIATLNCFVQITETDSIIDVYHHIPDVQELLSYIETLDNRREEIEQAETARGIAENTRVSNENTRKSNETSRVSAENTRISNENVRKANETARISAESSRATAESGRVTAESSRATAEASRVTAESSRATAETSRANAESSRATAETSRANAESARVTAETSRANAESSRATAETSRANAESARVTAESSRVTAQNARNAKIDNMEVAINKLATYADPTVSITETGSDNHKKITFGIAPGDPFVIQKTFKTVSAMNSYTGTDLRTGQFVLITSDNGAEDVDNAKMYVVNTAKPVSSSNTFTFVTDLSGAQGIKGNGIASASLNTSDYKLTLNWTEGGSYTTPISIRGATGATGATGNGISSASVGTDYKLKLNFTNGTSYTSDSIRGATGATGATGNGISNAEVTSDNKLKLTYTNGATYTTPISIKGEKGEPGEGSAIFVYDSTEKKLAVVFGSA